MTINDHLILSPESRERLENAAIRSSMALENGEWVDGRDTDISALVSHIRALDSRAENYARLFGKLDKLGDTLTESKEPTRVAVGKLIQTTIAEALTPEKETN